MFISLILQRRFVPVLFFVFGLAMGILPIPFFLAGLPPARSYVGGFAANLGSFGWEYMVQQVKALIEGWLSLWGSGIGALMAVPFVLPGLVAAQTKRAALVSPWKILDDLDFSKIQCRFYYMIPAALPDTETTDVDRFGTVHRELFRSKAPYDPAGVMHQRHELKYLL
jgi:hypothetical protein